MLRHRSVAVAISGTLGLCAWLTPGLVTPAHSYELHGWRWEQYRVGFGGDPEMLPFAELAVQYWNAAAGIELVPGGTDIVFLHKEPSQPARAQAFPQVQCRSQECDPPHYIRSCEIRGGALFFAEPDEQKVKLLVHELGHCIGLDHTTEESIMSSEPIGGLTWSSDDIEGARYLYGPPRREGWYLVRVPMLAH